RSQYIVIVLIWRISESQRNIPEVLEVPECCSFNQKAVEFIWFVQSPQCGTERVAIAKEVLRWGELVVEHYGGVAVLVCGLQVTQVAGIVEIGAQCVLQTVLDLSTHFTNSQLGIVAIVISSVKHGTVMHVSAHVHLVILIVEAEVETGYIRIPTAAAPDHIGIGECDV